MKKLFATITGAILVLTTCIATAATSSTNDDEALLNTLLWELGASINETTENTATTAEEKEAEKPTVTEEAEIIAIIPAQKKEDFSDIPTYNANGYYIWKDTVYYADQIVANADAKTFRYLGNTYAKDTKNVYKRGTKVIGPDVASFEHITRIYTKDKNNVYRDMVVLPNANPKTFKYIKNGYSTDGNYMYRGEKMIKGADTKTFVFLKCNYTLDKNSVYYKGVAIDANPKTFTFLDNYYYSTDGRSVFFFDKNRQEYWKVSGVDVKTFKSLGKGYGQDKNGTFFWGKRK